MADARITDTKLLDAFQEGFDGTTGEVLNSDNWMLVIRLLFEGTVINIFRSPWDEDPMDEDTVFTVREHLSQGPGAQVDLLVMTESALNEAIKAISAAKTD